MLKLRRIAAGSLHLWKGEMKMARMAPFSSSMARMAPFSSSMARMAPFSSSMAKRQIATPQGEGASKTNRWRIANPREKEKSSIFGKLQCLVSETLDLMVKKEEEKKGVSLTKEELLDWAEQLNKDRKHEYALEILEWMDKKKMDLSPSDHALFVDLLAKAKGYPAARDYFSKLDPDFNENDPAAKNQPAFAKLMHWHSVSYKKCICLPASLSKWRAALRSHGY